jgi:hypothetical protein
MYDSMPISSLRASIALCQFLTMAAGILLSGCATTSGYIKGQVMDVDSLKPISDAYVAIVWEGDRFTPPDSHTICFHASATLSDDEGKFMFLPWVRSDGLLPIIDIDNHLVIYKSGYQEVNSDGSEVVDGSGETGTKDRDKVSLGGNKNNPVGDHYLLKRYVGQRQKRLEYLRRLPRKLVCPNAGNSRKNLYPLLEAIYYEAKALSVSDEEKKQLQWFREIAAGAAVSGDNMEEMSQVEYDALINDFLKSHLQ